MEFFTLLLKFLWFIVILLSQFFWFVFKLVPLWLFITLLERLVIWWKQIVQLMLESWIWTFILLLFILFTWYLIWIWLLHLIVNVNVFKRVLDDNNSWKTQKKLNLTFEIVNTFRENFMNAIKAIHFKNKWQHILSTLESIKNNILVKFLFFQWWIWKNRHIKSVFEWLTSKWIWFNFVLLLAIIIWSWYTLTYEKIYTWWNWETIKISNWYEFIKDKVLSNDYVWKFTQWITSSIQDSITYRDRRIQMIAKAYYNTTLMKWLWWVELITSKEPLIKMWWSSEWWWNTESFEWLAKVQDWTILTSKNWIAQYLWKTVWAKVIQDSANKLWYSWIYFDEFMNWIYWWNATKYVKWTEMKSCLTQVNANRALKEKFFLDESLYNSRYFNQYLNWKLSWESTKKWIEWFELTSDKIKQRWKNYWIQESVIQWLLRKYNFSVPWQWWKWNAIWLHFILWKDWDYYIVDKWLTEEFINKFTSWTYKAWSTYTNPELLYNSNTKIADFCYWYSLLSQYKRKWTLPTTDAKIWNITYKKYDYEKILENLYISVWSKIKNETISDKDLLQLSWYLLTNTEFYLRDSFREWKDFSNLSHYFYMFWNKNQKQDYEFLIWWTITWLYSDLNSFINALTPAKIDNTKTIEENMKNKDVQDVIWKYASVNWWFSQYQQKIISTIKEKYDVMPSSKIFNDTSLLRLKSLFFNWYKQENLWFWWPVLENSKASNLLIWIDTKIEEKDITSMWTNEENMQEVLYFWKEIELAKTLWEWTQYKKVWVILWIIPLIESDLWFMNYILFLVYWILYIVFIFLMFWFSWIWQLLRNYAEYKSWKIEDSEFDFVQELIDLVVRFIIFIFLMRLYFTLTIF